MKLNVRDLYYAIKKNGVADRMLRFYYVPEDTDEAQYCGPVQSKFHVISSNLHLYSQRELHGYAIGQDILDFFERDQNGFEGCGSVREGNVVIKYHDRLIYLCGITVKDGYICLYFGNEPKTESKEVKQTYKIEMEFHDELKYESLVMGTPSAVKKHMVSILNDQLIRHMGRDKDFGPVELTKLDDVKTVANNRGDMFRLSVFVESEVSDYIVWAEPYEEVVIPIDDDGVPYTGWNEGFRTAIQEVTSC